MKCVRCNTEAYDLIMDGLCFNCSALQNIMQFTPQTYNMLKQMNDNALAAQKSKHIQVQFFTGKLTDIARQMNKFFKEEKIGKDRLIEIKITKGAILVVYE